MIGVYDYTVIATYAATVFGVCGLFFAGGKMYFPAVVCLLIAGLLDTFDGKIARTKKNRTSMEKNFGIQIDSLNDVICFGVLPSVISANICMDKNGKLSVWVGACLCFFVIAGLIRLAFFNVNAEEAQQQGSSVSFFHGLPITSSTLIYPLLYIAYRCLPKFKEPIFAIGLLITGILYISPIHVKKPGNKTIAVMAVFGIAELAALILL